MLEELPALPQYGGVPEKKKVSFYALPELAEEVRAACYEHRLTLEEFFTEAAREHIKALKKKPKAETEERLERLPAGRRIRPRS